MSLPLMCQPGASHSKYQDQRFRWDTTCPNRVQSSREDLLPTKRRCEGLGFGFFCLLDCFFAWLLGFSFIFLFIWFGFFCDLQLWLYLQCLWKIQFNQSEHFWGQVVYIKTSNKNHTKKINNTPKPNQRTNKFKTRTKIPSFKPSCPFLVPKNGQIWGWDGFLCAQALLPYSAIAPDILIWWKLHHAERTTTITVWVPIGQLVHFFFRWEVTHSKVPVCSVIP